MAKKAVNRKSAIGNSLAVEFCFEACDAMPQTTTAEDGLVVEHLHKDYPTPAEPLRVLRGLSLRLTGGDSLAVVGPSGSGKTTLLNILGTLDTPTAGRVRLDGQDPFALPAAALAHFRARRVDFIFQDHHLLGQLTAQENVLVAALAAGRVGPDEDRRAAELLERVGLADRRRHFPAELSGGQRQRVAIARALMNRPSLLLADEPTGDLDGATGRVVAELLLDLARDHGAMLIVATHSTELAARMARRLRLAEGRLVDGDD